MNRMHSIDGFFSNIVLGHRAYLLTVQLVLPAGGETAGADDLSAQ
jgi:hypothetical protein